MESVKTKWYQKSFGIIVLLFLFFPAGLFLMWNYAKWDKKIMWSITILLLIASMIAAATNKNTSQSSVQPNSTTASVTNPTNTPIPSPKALQTLEDKIKAQLGDGESMSTESATNLDTNQHVAGDKQIDITMNLGSDQWDLNMAKERVWARAVTLAQGIFPLDNTIYAIQLTANVPTTDVYGKTKQTELALVTIIRDTYNKIQWNNFDYHNIPTVADTYYEDKNIK